MIEELGGKQTVPLRLAGDKRLRTSAARNSCI